MKKCYFEVFLSTVPFSEGGRFDSSWLPTFLLYFLDVAPCSATALTFHPTPAVDCQDDLEL
jgi:hypothetical protein